jgi:hypothetical protein
MTFVALDAAYDAASWYDFAIALVGASAALAGLLVVAASINISRIIGLPPIVARLGATLAVFTGVLIIGLLIVVPDQHRTPLGVEIGIIGLVIAVFMVQQKELRRSHRPRYRGSMVTASVGVLAAITLAFAGFATAAGTAAGCTGSYRESS